MSWVRLGVCGVVVVVVAVWLGPGSEVEHSVAGAVCDDQVAVVACGLEAEEAVLF